jgi:hypothetical protein
MPHTYERAQHIAEGSRRAEGGSSRRVTERLWSWIRIVLSFRKCASEAVVKRRIWVPEVTSAAGASHGRLLSREFEHLRREIHWVTDSNIRDLAVRAT